MIVFCRVLHPTLHNRAKKIEKPNSLKLLTVFLEIRSFKSLFKSMCKKWTVNIASDEAPVTAVRLSGGIVVDKDLTHCRNWPVLIAVAFDLLMEITHAGRAKKTAWKVSWDDLTQPKDPVCLSISCYYCQKWLFIALFTWWHVIHWLLEPFIISFSCYK